MATAKEKEKKKKRNTVEATLKNARFACIYFILFGNHFSLFVAAFFSYDFGVFCVFFGE